MENNQQNTNNEQQQGLEITLEAVQQYIQSNEEGKKWFESQKDSHFSKGLETFKQKTMPKLIEEEISKRFPNETEEQKQIREMKQELENMKREKALESVKNKAILYANEKQLPLELVNLLVSNDEKATFKNLEVIESVFASHVQKLVDIEVKKRLGESGQNITASKDDGSAITKEMFKTMSYQDRVALLTTNPELYKELSE